MPTAELAEEAARLFPGKSSTELDLFLKRVLEAPEIVWSPESPETCGCAIYCAIQMLSETEDLVHLKTWLSSAGIHPAMETSVVESAKSDRSLCIVRKSGTWYAKRATVLNAYDEKSLEEAIYRKRLTGVSLREAASEYDTAYAHLFTSDAFFVKKGRVWHRHHAPVPPQELFGALTPAAPGHIPQ
jgi:hypothetical protein